MICKAEKQDLLILAEMSCKLWPHHTVDEMLAEYGVGVASPDAAFFLAYAEETPIGFAQCQLRHEYVEGTESSPVGYLEGIYVADEYRKQGVARGLLSACEAGRRPKVAPNLPATVSLTIHKACVSI